MPLGDRTGPWGLGPMIGRRACYCAGYPAPGYMNSVPGRGLGRRGFGRRRGGGRGFGWGPPPRSAPYWDAPYCAPDAPAYSAKQEAEALKDQAKYFQEALKDIEKRIEELESTAEGE